MIAVFKYFKHYYQKKELGCYCVIPRNRIKTMCEVRWKHQQSCPIRYLIRQSSPTVKVFKPQPGKHFLKEIQRVNQQLTLNLNTFTSPSPSHSDSGIVSTIYTFPDGMNINRYVYKTSIAVYIFRIINK